MLCIQSHWMDCGRWDAAKVLLNNRELWRFYQRIQCLVWRNHCKLGTCRLFPDPQPSSQCPEILPSDSWYSELYQNSLHTFDALTMWTTMCHLALLAATQCSTASHFCAKDLRCLPWAATSLEAGRRASLSRESIFWVKHRSKRPFWCRRVTKWCAGVGLNFPGNNSCIHASSNYIMSPHSCQ